MKKIKIDVDQERRQSLIQNFKALAFLSVFLLPFSLGKAAVKPALSANDTQKAVWS